MSYLFKEPSFAASLLNDNELRKMQVLWDCNCDINAIKEKWKELIGDGDTSTLLQRLRQTAQANPARIKRMCRIDPDMHEQFERNMWATIETLEDAFMFN